MTISTTWRFSSLASLADHLENKAREKRASIQDRNPRSHFAIEERSRATELESIVYLLRHCEIGE